MPALHRFAWLAAIALACLIALAAEAPVAVVAPGQIEISPVFQRVEVPPQGRVELAVTLTSPVDATLMAAEADCRCVALVTQLPTKISAHTPVSLHIAVAGVLPGVKTLTLRTTAGTAQVQIQLVTAGFGEGRDILATITSNALDRHLTPVVIIHDLRGEIRNCGCSAGSLGGIEVLAALPGTLRHTVPSARFVLSGDTNGSRDGVEAALVDHGWSRDDTAIVVSADPLAALNQPDVLAVIPSVPVQANHRRLLIPLVSGGMVAEVLLVDEQNQIVEHVRLPIDRTLAEDRSVLERFPERLSLHLDEHTVPSSACTSCHAGAHQTWVGSRHAAALSSLGPKDRVDACITCHSTPVSPGVVAGGVQCQACHLGAAAHAQGAGRVRTTGTTDCRTCHDGRHHPGFNPVAAWEAIAHGH